MTLEGYHWVIKDEDRPHIFWYKHPQSRDDNSRFPKKENTEKYIKHLSLNKIDFHNTLNTGFYSMTQLCRAVQIKT